VSALNPFFAILRLIASGVTHVFDTFNAHSCASSSCAPHSRSLRYSSTYKETNIMHRSSIVQKLLQTVFVVCLSLVGSVLASQPPQAPQAPQVAEANEKQVSQAPKSASLARSDVPDGLRSWLPWVESERPDKACPVTHNVDERWCVWPGRLVLQLGATGGTFAFSVEVMSVPGPSVAPQVVELPGKLPYWPQAVQVNGRPAAVTTHHGRPALQLPAGTYAITGKFEWTTLPESLAVPSTIGLIDAQVNGKRLEQPAVNDEGQLWLQKEAAAAVVGTALDVKIYRMIDDDVPLQVTTEIRLIASGRQQEITLPNAALPGLVPLSLTSPIPARFEADGRLRLQVRPGRWTVTLISRSTGPINSLTLPALTDALKQPAIAAGNAEAPRGTPAEAAPITLSDEVWVFRARPQLRMATPEGLVAVDPQQTSLLEEWRKFPAFVARPGDTLKLTQTKRGDAEPAADRLSLSRDIWLDFDGHGLTMRDNIRGEMNGGWRLSMPKPATLGRASSQDTQQLITTLDSSGNAEAGIEVRQGKANITAESRLEAGRSFSATGWSRDFNSVETTLHLPPGWRLLAASGADRAVGSWLTRWTLLDVFAVLVTTIAVAYLFGHTWGVLALVVFVLTHLERPWMTGLWLAALALIAITRALPTGKLQKFGQVLKWGCLGALGALLVPWMVDHVRTGLHPTLEMKRHDIQRVAEVSDSSDREIAIRNIEKIAIPAMAPSRSMDSDVKSKKAMAYKLDQYDTKAMIQTGAGLPQWSWRGYSLQWEGRVSPSQQVQLWLLSPTENLALSIMRVVLLSALLLCLTGWVRRWPPGFTPKGLTTKLAPGATPKSAASAAVAAIALLLPLGLLEPSSAYAQTSLPTDDQLSQLKQRLVAPPSCLPDCASIARMSVNASGDNLVLRLEAHAHSAVALPLPGNLKQWQPQQVLLAGKPAALQRDAQGVLWITVPAGVHQIVMEGQLRTNGLAIELPLKPMRVDRSLQGWALDGVRDTGEPDQALSLTRVQSSAATDSAPQAGGVPLVLIERTLSLGLQWQVTTRVQRLSPADTPLALALPMLAGESITSPEPRAEGGKALVSLPPRVSELSWESALNEAATMTLTAATEPNIVESWRVNVGPQWNVKLAGTPVVAHQADDRWMPQWRPWPGEQVQISAVRPAAVSGQTLTIDRTEQRTSIGTRDAKTDLTLTIRSSRGGTHTVLLPEGATLESVKINKTQQPIRQQGQEVRLPVTPGEQIVAMTWREPRGAALFYRTSSIDVKAPSVNNSLSVNPSKSRWVLFIGGPTVGPAVIVWGYVLALVIIAYGLAKTKLTPLTTAQWLLLAIGFAQVPFAAFVIAAGWLLVLGLRGRIQPERRWVFNLTQLALFAWTFATAVALLWALRDGLMGFPSMDIQGNQSSATNLRWFQDRSDSALPQAWVVSVHLWVYRGLMLAWALWLAYSLMQWIRWGWGAYTTGGAWRTKPPKAPKAQSTQAQQQQTAQASSDTPTPNLEDVMEKP
jgi:hypothetical protein